VPANAEGEIVAGGIEAQTRQVMDNLRRVLALAGAGFDDVCKCTCWLQDARDFGAFNRVYMSYFPNGRPARSTTEARLMVDAKVEIDVVAYKPKAA
jgi:enamine deaminase RidA (YjgF/YER057c/UK114 family)